MDLPHSGRVRARFRGDATRAPLESHSLRIRVAPIIGLGLSARRIRRRRQLAVSGSLTPATEPTVVVLLERKVGGRYRRVRKRRAAVQNGRFLRYLRPGRAGVYRVTVRVPGAKARQYVRVLR